MYDRTGSIFLGIVLIMMGIGVILFPERYDILSGVHLDYSRMRWPLGVLSIVIGMLFIRHYFSKKAKQLEEIAEDKKAILMCEKCLKPYYKKDVENLLCPKCTHPLENIDGFYNRHPELK